MANVVEINPLSRVEGHGSLKVFLEGDRVERVELRLTESPRLFEALLVGRNYQEVPDIVCRICSLCSTVHKVTALLAVESAFAVEVPYTARLTRELMLHGGLIQSHALHLYCLVLPDRLGLSGVADLARQAPELLQRGLDLKRIGNLIQERAGGRLIHPVNITLGGLGQRLSQDTLRLLEEEIAGMIPACRDTVALFNAPLAEPQLPAPNYLALEPGPDLYRGATVRARNGRSFPVERYRDFVEEEVRPYSRAKYARVLDAPPSVGALSRLNLAPPVSGWNGELFNEVSCGFLDGDMRANALAQAVELSVALERSLELVRELQAQERRAPVRVPVRPRAAEGSVACEAPRGLLIHSYRFDQAGICRAADVITPTSLNQGALTRDLTVLATALTGADSCEMTLALEQLVRCYDPCISCSVHLLRR